MTTNVFIPVPYRDHGKRIVLRTDLNLVMAVANHLGANGYGIPSELDEGFWIGERQFYRFTVEDENAAFVLRLKFGALDEAAFIKRFSAKSSPLRRAVP